jgi:hypothetical protein
LRTLQQHVRPGGGGLDLLACNVPESDGGKWLVSRLQNAVGGELGAVGEPSAGGAKHMYRVTEGRVLEGAPSRYFARGACARWGAEVALALPRGDPRMWLPRSLEAAVPSNMGRADDGLDMLTSPGGHATRGGAAEGYTGHTAPPVGGSRLAGLSASLGVEPRTPVQHRPPGSYKK